MRDVSSPVRAVYACDNRVRILARVFYKAGIVAALASSLENRKAYAANRSSASASGRRAPRRHKSARFRGEIARHPCNQNIEALLFDEENPQSREAIK